MSRAVVVSCLIQPPAPGDSLFGLLLYSIGHIQNNQEPPRHYSLCIVSVSVLCAEIEVGLHACTRDVLLTLPVDMTGAVCMVDTEGRSLLLLRASVMLLPSWLFALPALTNVTGVTFNWGHICNMAPKMPPSKAA